MNIFREMFHAVFDIDAYPSFAKNRRGKVFLYALVLTVILFCITLASIWISFRQEMGGGISWAYEKYVPDFELKNGKFSLASPVSVDTQEIYLKIDTDSDVFQSLTIDDLDHISQEHEAVVIADADKMYISNQMTRTEYEFKNSSGNIDKASVKHIVMMSIKVGVVIGFLIMLVSYFIEALIYALVGLVYAKIIGARNLRYGKIFIFAIYGATLGSILSTLLKAFAMDFPMSSYVFVLITIFFIERAIRAWMKQNTVPEEEVLNTEECNFYGLPKESNLFEGKEEKSKEDHYYVRNQPDQLKSNDSWIKSDDERDGQ